MGASVARTSFYQQLLRLFEHHDVLACPAPRCGPSTLPSAGRSRSPAAMDSYHRWMEVVIYRHLCRSALHQRAHWFQCPGPAHGLQLIGRPHGDVAPLALAAAYEGAIGDWLAVRPGA